MCVVMSRNEQMGGRADDARESSSTSPPILRLVGFGLVVVAGLLMMISAFTPWVTTGSSGIESGSQVGVVTYSGVDLLRDCARGAVLCRFAGSDVNPPSRILTGAWPIVLGAGLVVVGGLSVKVILTRRYLVFPWRDRIFWLDFMTCFFVVVSLVLAIVQLLLLDDARYNAGLCPSRGACVEARWGPTFGLVAPALGLIGISLVGVGEIAGRWRSPTQV
jgi:hypothetical protein